MNQEQPQVPDDQDQDQDQAPIKYGDLFAVHGEIADQAVLPIDASTMQTAESTMLGQIQKGGAAAIMQSAAARNEKAGHVHPNDINTVAGERGVSIMETDLPGNRIITEAVGGQVVGQYSQRAPMSSMSTTRSTSILDGQHADAEEIDDDGITIGEALEATALTSGKKPVDYGDAAAIQAAEMRATGRPDLVSGGVAAAAQSAATRNARVTMNEKTKLGDILTDATLKLPADRPATRQDAEGVTSAEMRNSPTLTTHPTGVAASVAAAARLNQL